MSKDKLAQAQKELENLKAKHDVDFQINLDFPKYRELPDELQLALRVIFKENPQFVVSLVEKPKDNDNKNGS